MAFTQPGQIMLGVPLLLITEHASSAPVVATEGDGLHALPMGNIVIANVIMLIQQP